MNFGTMGGNNACLVCKFDDRKVKSMERLVNLLERADLDTNNTHTIRFNWGVAERCKLGMSCRKVDNNRHRFDSLTFELNVSLSKYLHSTRTKKNEDLYYDILSYLRGVFPQVYNQFTIEWRKKS